jgi:hypothetical protein
MGDYEIIYNVKGKQKGWVKISEVNGVLISGEVNSELTGFSIKNNKEETLFPEPMIPIDIKSTTKLEMVKYEN